ncbi:ATP-binding protein [uncultured Peptoniphilus sp.]|uniref:ATP-binding protein n=1 Tax=uncultured Peptoniphilus sp. TaxID=254354 RepID=UPI002588199B|nr:ATP-binding protein [uncultured Peptoniphilus sp.]MDU6784261.1 ATP-binding protein [Peptoniphilus harei]
MDYIFRTKYIEKIKKFIDKPIVKILTGMRRVGKSTILNIIKDQVLKDVPDENKIYMNFESFEFFDIKDANALKDYLSEKLKDKEGKVYFFFDEIQLVKDWEKVINGLRVSHNCDIYITGSNSKLISGDLATLLAGRYVEFEIQPFTFDEFSEIYRSSNLSREELFQKFIKIGGMPGLKYFNLNEEVSQKYLNDIYNTVLVKDVLNYNNIRDVDIFNRILSFAMQNIGANFSASAIRNYLKSENRNISVDTVLNYLEYCHKAFVLKKVPRYDLGGKKLLKVDEKYYLTDHGFRQSVGFSNVKDIEKTLENIVYIELLSRGYHVKIGKVKDREIDFVAKKGEDVSYFQIAYLMENEKTRNREFGVYDLVTDNYPKYVLSMDKLDFSQRGIVHKNIIDFLLENEK